MEHTPVQSGCILLGLQLSLQLKPDLHRLERMRDGDGTARRDTASNERSYCRRHLDNRAGQPA
jgi:hypothetical protein